MKILFAADLHGIFGLYRELYELASQADVVLLGGDLLPTRIDSSWALIRGSFDFNATLSHQLSFIDSKLLPLHAAFMQTNPDIRFYFIPGNHDWQEALLHLKNQLNIVPAHNQLIDLGELKLFGYGGVPDSPFWVKDFARRDLDSSQAVTSRYSCFSGPAGIRQEPDHTYASIESDLRDIELPADTIGLFHAPPYCGDIDSLFNGKNIGSQAIADFIRRSQPLISLHGHIHEAPYVTGQFTSHIGSTPCINPGHAPQRLHAVSFDTDNIEASLKHMVFNGQIPTGIPFKEKLGRSLKAGLMKRVLMR